MFYCFHCGNKITDERIYKSTQCSSCGYDVKVCKNCQFYAPGRQWDCRESISEQVMDKEKANFCDFFKMSGKKPENGKNNNKSDKEKFNNLFGS